MSSRHLVDPELAPLLDLFPAFALSAETLPIARGRQLPMPESEPVPVDLHELTIPGPADAPDVAIRLYRPTGATGPLPTILHLHGGGYVMGSAASMEPIHRTLVHELQCVLVSVEYRLAPETPFPGAVEDAYAALAWLHAEGAAHGVDAAHIGVMGESAGGGLAAGLALLARDRGEFRLAFQHLIYPMIDDRTASGIDAGSYQGEFIWFPEANRFGWSSLLGHAPGGPDTSPYAAAARSKDVGGLPPTFIVTGALDLFAEEDIDYARRLLRAGVPTELHVYPGAFHGFTLAPDAQVAKDSRRDALASLKRALRPN